jgi:8-oxo-dGTP pyrophosphatase MutT (NUDIX family)
MMLGKVTVFITRDRPAGRELLLLRHPYAGLQLPAGTVEPGEQPEAAALREAHEETGLREITVSRYLGAEHWAPPDGHRLLQRAATVYARPDVTSFAWARLPRSVVVALLREQPPFVQVRYEEWDDEERRAYVTYQISGWIEQSALIGRVERHFFHLETTEASPETWEVFTDNHRYRLFWASLDALPRLEAYQNDWLRFLLR